MPIVIFSHPSAPKSRGTEKVRIAGGSTRKGEPLLYVWSKYVVLERKIHTGMRRSSGDDGRQMRGKLFEDCPLIEACVRAAPHGHFSVGIGLLGEPFDDVVAVFRFVH